MQLPAEAGPASRLDSDGTVLATLSGQKVELWKAEDNSRMAAMDLPAAVADFSLNTVTDRLAVQLADGQLLLWSIKEAKTAGGSEPGSAGYQESQTSRNRKGHL